MIANYTSEKLRASHANTDDLGGKDLKILDIIKIFEITRLKPRVFQTTHDIENFEIFTTNGLSIDTLYLTASIKFDCMISI